MAGTKRSAEVDLDDRAKKLLRELCRGSSVSEGRTLGSPSVWKVLASDFYTATSSAVAAFDWSSLTTALEEEGFPDTRRRAEEEDLVFVPEAAWPVPVSKKCIFREITRWLDLQIHGFGFLIDDAGLKIGWIDVDIPPSEVGGVRGRTKFYSEPCTLKVDAIEDVCSHAVEWMIRECCVQVVDLNYHKMKELEGKVGVMENLVSVYCDNADASKAKEETVRRRYAALFTEAQRVLKKYDDVVPADRGPATRTEQLVCELAVLIAKGDAMAAAPAEMG